MKISKNRVVTFEYTLKDPDGEIIDSSHGGEPLAYIHGSGGIIPGLEAAMEGHVVGDSFEIKISPEDGYGKRDERLVQRVPREEFAEIELELGMQFQQAGEDDYQILTVVDIGEKEVTLDGNHALAGMPLHFDVNVVDIREATTEELSHGHVHGPGGHHHH